MANSSSGVIKTEVFKQLGVPLERSTKAAENSVAETKVQKLRLDQEKNQRLWFWVALVVFFLLLVETLVSRFSGQIDPNKKETVS